MPRELIRIGLSRKEKEALKAVASNMGDVAWGWAIRKLIKDEVERRGLLTLARPQEGKNGREHTKLSG